MSANSQIDEFRKGLKVEPCVKTNVPQLIGFFGNSGGGKTVTGLVTLVGLLGPDVKIGGIDSENKRMGFAADVVTKLAMKKYGRAPQIVVINIDPPFHPLKYVAAIEELQAQGCKGLICDSTSHAWNGQGGYLDLKEADLDRMAGTDWQKREKCAMAAAAHVKPGTHGKLIQTLLQSKMATVLCFRSKDKTNMKKGADGRMEVVKDDFGTPIQEAGMIYEMLIAGEIYAKEGVGGYCIFKGPGCKHTHPDILKLLPSQEEQFSFEHAESLAAWCNGGKPPTKSTSDAPKQPATGNPSSKEDELKAAKRVLWTLVKVENISHGDQTWKTAWQWLVDEAMVEPHQTSNNMTAEELLKTAEKVRAKLNPPKSGQLL